MIFQLAAVRVRSPGISTRCIRTLRFNLRHDLYSLYTLFKYDAATLVGLDLSTNPLFTEEVGTISGVRDTVYFQKVSLLFEAGWRIEVIAGFIKKLAFLGRNGFFDNFKVTFDHSTNSRI